MGTEATFATLKPFLELQRQMALTHGSATRTIEFRKPWDFDIKPHKYKQAEIEPLLTHPHASSLRWLDSMKLNVDLSLTEGSITFEGSSVTVHCSEVRLDQTIELCTQNAKQQYICANFIALEEESDDAIQCPMFGYWM